MTTREQNDFLTQTGPGTPMGNLFRRYWIPALLSDEIAEPDCAPVRVKVLCERLLAFRDTRGRVGVIDEFCAHRGVSLWFGRNEENGLRCAYHGWKYDVTGQCIEVPSEPEASGFCKKIKLTCYPCVELGDVVWIYMGPPEHRPPLPNFEWAKVPHAIASCPNAPRNATTCRRWRAVSIRRTCRFSTATTCAAIRSTSARAPN